MYMSEKAMAPHSSTFAWKIPWTEEPGRLQSMGSWILNHWTTKEVPNTLLLQLNKWRQNNGPILELELSVEIVKQDINSWYTVHIYTLYAIPCTYVDYTTFNVMI